VAIDRRIKHGYLDKKAESLDEALRMVEEAKEKGEAVSIGLLGNAADVFPELVKRSIIPDIVTDQTAAHDPLNGYIPSGYTVEEAAELRKSNPEEYLKRVGESVVKHVEAMVEMKRRGAVAFEYGTQY